MSKFIQALLAFVTALWIKGKKFMEEHAEATVEFVERLKLMLDNPKADFIVKIIPGVGDDKALEWLRKALPVVLNYLNVKLTCLYDLELNALKTNVNVVVVLEELATHISIMPKSSRGGLYRDIASLLAMEKARLAEYKHLDDITRERSDLAVQLQYLKLKDKDRD